MMLQRPFGSPIAHLVVCSVDVFLTNLASTVCIQVMNVSGQRMLTFKHDVLLYGAIAALWRLDSMTDMEVVYILFSKVSSVAKPVLLSQL